MARTGVVAFAFGVPENLPSNLRIARITGELAHRLAAPVYTQPDVRLTGVEDVELASQKDGASPPPTLQIANGAAAWAARRGIQEALVVAAKPHARRCRRDLEWATRKAGIEVDVRILPAVEASIEEEWYCPESLQPRTRNQRAWRRREWILERLPMSVYRRVSGV